MKQKILNLTLLLFCMIVGMGSAWGEEYSETFSYGSSGWTLTNYTDNSTYYLVPKGNDPSVATLSGIFTGKTISSDVTVTINCATYGNGTNPSESTFSIYKSSECKEEDKIIATKGGTLPTSNTYTNVTYTIEKETARSFANDLAVKITKPGKQIRLKSIKVEFDYAEGVIPTHNVTFYSNGSVISGPEEVEEGNAVQFPIENPQIDGYVFVGWTENNINGTSDTEPTLITDVKMGTEDITLFAVYAHCDGVNSLVKIDKLSNITEGTYIIKNGDFILPNVNTGGSTPPSANLQLREMSLENVTEEMKWIFTAAGGDNNFYINNAGGDYLYETNNNNGLRVGVTKDYWKFEENGEGFALKGNTNSRYCAKYASGSDWRSYTSKNATNYVNGGILELYKISVGTYYDYCTTVNLKALDHITATNPTKTIYKVGETFSTEGMIVTAYYEDTAEGKTVKNYTYTVDDNKVTISYTENGVTKTADVAIDVVALDKIEITTPPAKTEYTEGDDFDATGMVVKATWGTEDGKKISEVVNATVTGGTNLQPGTTSVTLSYSHEGTTKETTQAITVNAIPTYTVTIETPENGTLVVKNGETDINSGDAVKNGTTLTITATPNDGYKFRNWQAVDGTTHTFTTGTTYKIDGKAVTIKANFDALATPTITLNEAENGSIASKIDGEDVTSATEGQTVTLTATPNDGYVFKGWTVDGAEVEDASAATTTFEMGTEDVSVSATFDVMPLEFTLNINNSLFDTSFTGPVTGAQAARVGNNFTGSAEGISVSYYKPSTDTNNNMYISDTEIRMYNRYTSLAFTAPEGYNIVGITFTKGKEGNLNNLSVTEGEGNYLSGSWTGEAHEVVFGASQTTSIAAAKITLQKTERLIISISDKCYDSESGKYYGTFSSSKAFKVPANLTVEEVAIENEILSVQPYAGGAIVPANTGVMVSSVTPGNHEVIVSVGGTSVLGSDNCLRPSGGDGITADAMAAAAPNCTYYRLTMHKGTQIGYWWGAENGAAFDLAANKAYLAVPSGTSVKANLWFGGVETSISAPEPLNAENDVIYNLNGQRVSSATKGIYIKNGKKYFVK